MTTVLVFVLNKYSYLLTYLERIAYATAYASLPPTATIHIRQTCCIIMLNIRHQLQNNSELFSFETSYHSQTSLSAYRLSG